MARKMRAAGLWEVKKDDPAPAEKPPESAAVVLPGPKPKRKAAPSRDETLYSFTFRLRLDEREWLREKADERRSPTAPGRGEASTVLRELIDEAMAEDE